MGTRNEAQEDDPPASPEGEADGGQARGRGETARGDERSEVRSQTTEDGGKKTEDI
jgi:hypothetical protein